MMKKENLSTIILPSLSQRIKVLVSVFCLLFWTIHSASGQKNDFSGIYRLQIPTTQGNLPFQVELTKDHQGWRAFAVNADESLPFDRAIIKGDSAFLYMDIFESLLILKIQNENVAGEFVRNVNRPNQKRFKLMGKKGENFRFVKKEETTISLEKKYDVKFITGEKVTQAVCLLSQDRNVVNGTFLTKTGDYRYLAGNIIKDSLFLSCFDGTHVYLFKAKILPGKLVGGKLVTNFVEFKNWEGIANPNAELPDPYTKTYLKSGYSKFQFSGITTKGDTINSEDKRFENKPLVVQISGTWCPNCMDESKFLSAASKKYKDVEFIGLSFEKSLDTSYAFPRIQTVVNRFNIPYPIILTGLNNSDDASAKLSSLNRVMSFPTTIFINRKGEVKSIHTGFSGPATGKYFEEFVLEFEKIMEEIRK
ncbi:MAG: TlpA family protein disulfide reductase [Leadbetterella sp.]